MKIIQPFKLLEDKNELVDAVLEFKKAFKAIAVFSAVANLLLLVPSIYMLEIYDRVLSSRNHYTLLVISLIVLFLYGLLSLIERIRSLIAIKIGEQLDQKLSQRVYVAAFEANLKDRGLPAGQYLQDLTIIRQFMTGQGLFAFFDAPWFPIYLIVIYLFNVWLGVFATVSVAILIFLTWANSKASEKPLSEANQLAAKSSALATNQLRNAEVIQAMGMLDAMKQRWFALHDRFIKQQSSASIDSSGITSISRFTRLSVQSSILGIAALLVLDNQISAGMMIAASILLGKTLGPVEMLINVWKSWQATHNSYQRIVKLLDNHPPELERMSLPAPIGKIDVENLHVTAPGKKEFILRNLNFSLSPGDVLGIIGPSAAGKSTLAKLLIGHWPAQAGSVRLDGADIHTWNKSELGQYIGYMPQEVSLFDGTLAENISRFEDIDSEKIIEAAQLAGVHELILKFPEGYETHIGTDGEGLSGGQKQRIGLARALYGQPKFIVLDEPNSNLDEAGERSLSDTIELLRSKNITMVLITHRSSILKKTNKLLILQDGQQKAFGPTQEIIQALQQAKVGQL
jgi:ATP-binding cassette subfamily C exporter for protease/lipase